MEERTTIPPTEIRAKEKVNTQEKGKANTWTLSNQYRALDLTAARNRVAKGGQPEFKSLGDVSREAGFTKEVSVGQMCGTKPFMLLDIMGVIIVMGVIIGPALDVAVIQFGRYCIEIQINSLKFETTNFLVFNLQSIIFRYVGHLCSSFYLFLRPE